MNESMTVLLEDVIGIARQAGELVLEVYRSDFEVRGKDDASPVTEADERAEALILQALAALTPQIPVRSAGVSGWWTRWTAPGSSSSATVSSPSISP